MGIFDRAKDADDHRPAQVDQAPTAAADLADEPEPSANPEAGSPETDSPGAAVHDPA